MMIYHLLFTIYYLGIRIMDYEKAIKEIETIVDQMERNELDIDQLAEKLKEAKRLIKECKDKLYKTNEEVKALLAEE